MMVPGLALFYGGMVRSKNVLSVLMQVITVFSLLVVLWIFYGYSLAFSGEGAWLGNLDKLFLKGVNASSHPSARHSPMASACRNRCSSRSRAPSPASPAR